MSRYLRYLSLNQSAAPEICPTRHSPHPSSKLVSTSNQMNYQYDYKSIYLRDLNGTILEKVFNKHTYADITSVLEKMFLSLYNDFLFLSKILFMDNTRWIKIAKNRTKIFARRIKEIFE